MTVGVFGAVLSTSNNTVEAATLQDGRVIVGIQPGPVQVYSPAGTLLGSVDPYQGGAGISVQGGGGAHVAALADGGFVVTGAKGSDIAFRVYNADLTERTSGPVVIATPGFFNGGVNYGHILKALPGGGFVVEWNTIEGALPAGPLGVTNGGTPIYEGGSGPQGTSIDVRASIYDAAGALVSAPRFIVTQGTVTFPTYQVESRFGQQYISDVDVLPTGEIVSTIYGQRWVPPSGGDINATFTSGAFYDTFRINNGATGAAIVGETPYNATTPIGPERTAGTGPHQTVILSSGLIAGIYTIDTEVSGPSQYQSKLQLFNTNGTPNGVEIDLGLAFSNAFQTPQIQAIATPSGGFLLAYVTPASAATASDSTTYNVYVREYASNGTIINTTQLTSASGRESLLGLTQGPDGTIMVTSRIDFTGSTSTQFLAVAGAGDSLSNGNGTAETLNATGTNRNWISSGGGADIINGGAGTNYLYGGDGNSTFNAGSGLTIVRGGAGNETINGAGQNDTFEGGAGADVIFGAGGNDILIGGAGADQLTGGSGEDSLQGGAGDDVIDGGIGVDTIDFIAATGGVTVNLMLTAVQAIGGGMGSDAIAGVENVIGTRFGDAITGDGSANLITGGVGNDTLDGAAGTDTVNYADRAVAVAINPFINTASVAGGELDTIFNFENFTGGSGNDILQGNSNANIIAGGGGADLIYGHDGFDTIDGGAGNDVIAGGAGNDSIAGGNGSDWLYGEDGADNLSGTAKSGGFDVLVGGIGADTLEGSAGGFDYFYGGTGVNGGTGDGNDTYVVRAATGIKVMNDFEAGGTADVVRLVGTGLSSFAQVQAAMSFSGVINGTVLVVDGSTQIWFLNGTQPSSLTASDFLFA